MTDYNRFPSDAQTLSNVQLLESAYRITDLFQQQEAQRKINESRRELAEGLRQDAKLRIEQLIYDVNGMLSQGIFKGEKGDKGNKGDQGIQGIQGVPGMTSSEADLIRLQEQARVSAEVTRASTFGGWQTSVNTWSQQEADRVLAEIAREAVVDGYADDLALKASAADISALTTVVNGKPSTGKAIAMAIVFG